VADVSFPYTCRTELDARFRGHDGTVMALDSAYRVNGLLKKPGADAERPTGAGGRGEAGR